MLCAGRGKEASTRVCLGAGAEKSYRETLQRKLLSRLREEKFNLDSPQSDRSAVDDASVAGAWERLVEHIESFAARLVPVRRTKDRARVSSARAVRDSTGCSDCWQVHRRYMRLEAAERSRSWLVEWSDRRGLSRPVFFPLQLGSSHKQSRVDLHSRPLTIGCI